MKIISVKFLNLNSLKGLHEIRFDEAPFNENGLFAITGRTGAGKTTILDAITVALYGRMHRHDKNAEESMTRFTSECFSEVEFEVKNKIYKSRWALRRSHGKSEGRMQTAKMELCEMPSGNIISDQRLAEVQQQIIGICGLDYHQFLRSVMLAQGDFTQLLKSRENERSELLEKITDTGIYSEISSFIYRKTSDKEQELKLLKARINDVQLLSTDAKEEIKSIIQVLENEEKGLRNEQKSTEQKSEWLRQINNLFQKKSDYEKQLQHLIEIETSNKVQFEKLHSHKKAIIHRPQLTELSLFQKTEFDLKNNIETVEKQLPGLRTELQQINTYFDEVTKDYKTASEELSVMTPVLDEVAKKDTELKSLKEQSDKSKIQLEKTQKDVEQTSEIVKQKKQSLDDCNDKIKKILDWKERNKRDETLEKELPDFLHYKKELSEYESTVNLISSALHNNNQSEETEKKKLAELHIHKEKLTKEKDSKQTNKLKIELDKATELNGSSIEKLETEKETLPEIINLLKEQKRLAEELQKNITRIDKDKNEINIVGKKLLDEKKEFEIITKQKAAAEENLSDLQKMMELQIRIQKYESDREQLKPGEPCPLCGSVQHPYHENENYKISDAEFKRNKQQKVVAEINKNLNAKSIVINNDEHAIEKLQIEIEESEKNIQEISKNFKQNNQKISESIVITDIAAIKNALINNNKMYETISTTILKVRQFDARLAEIESAINKNEQEQISNHGQLRLVESQIKTLNNDAQKLKDEQQQATQKVNETIEWIKIFLERYGQKFEKENLNPIEKNLLTRTENFKKCLAEENRQTLNHATLQSEYTGLLSKEKEAIQTIKELNENYESDKNIYEKKETDRMQLFDKKDPFAERNRMNQHINRLDKLRVETSAILKSKQESVNELMVKQNEYQLSFSKNETEIETVTGALQTKLKISGISNIEELKTLILPDEEANKIETLQQHLASEIKTASGILKNTSEEYLKETEKKLTTETEETLSAVRLELEEKIKEQNQKVVKQKIILQIDTDAALNHAAIANEILLKQNEFNRWNELCVLIGSADGKKFSRYAQGLTMARLTELANRHLRKLSDRYTILKSPDKDLELEILDHYQADVSRPMATLSGGESFLVSLSLALGLSDLAGRKVQIRSLFIDEGFGTLDSTTLDIAITALENIQAEGKMIGIISHVEALKDRIGTQIEVVKQSGGYSNIKITSYGKTIIV